MFLSCRYLAEVLCNSKSRYVVAFRLSVDGRLTNSRAPEVLSSLNGHKENQWRHWKKLLDSTAISDIRKS